MKGQYSLVEADGSLRTVDYTADDLNGFNAVVTKSLPAGHGHAVVAPAAVAVAPVATQVAEAPVVVDARIAHDAPTTYLAPAPVHQTYAAVAPAPVHQTYAAVAPAPVHQTYAAIAPAQTYAAVAPATYQQTYAAVAPAPVHQTYAAVAPAVASTVIASPVHQTYAAPASVAYSGHVRAYAAPVQTYASAPIAGYAAPFAVGRTLAAPVAYGAYPYAQHGYYGH